MPIYYLGHTDQTLTADFQARMNRLNPKTEEYKKCLKIAQFLNNRIRAEQRLDVETIQKQQNKMKHQKVLYNIQPESSYIPLALFLLAVCVALSGYGASL